MSVRWAPRSQRRSKPWAKGTLGPAVCIAVARRDFKTGELHLRAGDMVTVHPSVTDTREGWCIVQGPRASGAVPETLLEIRATKDPEHAISLRLQELQVIANSGEGATLLAHERHMLALAHKSAAPLPCLLPEAMPDANKR